jgi:quinol monooxygenase YgiN
MSASVKIVAILTARPDKVAELKDLLDGMVVHSRAEPGNLRYDLWRDRADPHRFVLDELYSDDAAVEMHRQTQHFKNYLSKINDLADRTALVLESLSTD